MKTALIFAISLIFACTGVRAQTDSPETLQWTKQQADYIDSVLYHSLLSHEPLDLMLKITDCYIRFDAVAMSGLYCNDARMAAERGKNLCDVINFRLEKDLNSIVLRATEARLQAEKLRRATLLCVEKCEKNAEQQIFRPVEIIQNDLEIVLLDLSDGLAAEDMHILSQKTEHAIRTLHEIEHLAMTLSNCYSVFRLAGEAILLCEGVLVARNWTEVKTAVEQASNKVKIMQGEVCF